MTFPVEYYRQIKDAIVFTAAVNRQLHVRLLILVTFPVVLAFSSGRMTRLMKFRMLC